MHVAINQALSAYKLAHYVSLHYKRTTCGHDTRKHFVSEGTKIFDEFKASGIHYQISLQML